MNTEVWRDFREKILAPGGSVDARSKFRNFVGREPSMKAFLDFQALSDNDLTAFLYQQPVSDINLSDISLHSSPSQDEEDLQAAPRHSASEVLDQMPRHETQTHEVQSYQSVFKPTSTFSEHIPTPSENVFPNELQ